MGTSSGGPVTCSCEAIRECSKVFLQPVTDAAEESGGRRAQGARLAWRLGTFGEREMQEPDAGREGRSPSRLGEPGDAQRPPDADLLVEDEAGELAGPRQLAGAAREHDAAAGDLVVAARLEAVAHQLEGLFEAR